MARTIPLVMAAMLGQCLMPGTAAHATPPVLQLPIVCTLGRDCFVQQYMDEDPGPGAHDYACGNESYNDHRGTDIRVRTLMDVERGVAVVAAAPGTVRAVRDGMPDRLARSAADRAAVAGQDCGNGVVIDHDDGWQTQYCHLRQGSVVVTTGDKVAAGTRLGDVGYSGMAAFPHIHITVRHEDEVIDPFTGKAQAKAACNDTTGSLWAGEVLAALAYRPGQLLDVGFMPTPPSLPAIEAGNGTERTPKGDWDVVFAWGWAINLKVGDGVEIALDGPAGRLARNNLSLVRAKAQLMLYAGARRPAGGWAPGRYVTSFTVRRDGKTVLSTERVAMIE